jgi:hypothetical protein
VQPLSTTPPPLPLSQNRDRYVERWMEEQEGKVRGKRIDK